MVNDRETGYNQVMKCCKMQTSRLSKKKGTKIIEQQHNKTEKIKPKLWIKYIYYDINQDNEK